MNAKWVLVAGASRGIGLATAKMLLDKGYSVVAAARNLEVLRSMFSPNEYDTNKVKLISWDFSAPEMVKDFADKIYNEVGAINGLVYCAGMQLTLPLSMSQPQYAREIFDVNTFSAIEVVRCFSRKKMILSEGASFVLISSLAAKEGALGKSLYGASKAALEGFIPSAAAELAQKNIRLNAIVPGIVKTDMSDAFLSKMTPVQIVKLEESYPLGLGKPDDVASIILWLLSLGSRWVTGQTYIIDGGHMVRS